MCDVETRFYLTNYVMGEEPCFLEYCGKGIRLLCCGNTYTVDASDPNNIKDVEVVALTICDVIMGIFALVTILPTLLAIVGKIIAQDDRITSLFHQIIDPNEGDSPTSPIHPTIPSSTPSRPNPGTTTGGATPANMGRPDGTCDFTKVHVGVFGLQQKPKYDGPTLEELKTTTQSLDIRDINTIAQTLFDTTDRSENATLEIITGIINVIPTLYSNRDPSGEIRREVHSLLRIILHMLQSLKLSKEEKTEILTKVAGLAGRTCIFAFANEFHTIVVETLYKDSKLESQIALWIYNFKIGLFRKHFEVERTVYDSTIDRRTGYVRGLRNLEIHATSAVQDALGNLLGLNPTQDARHDAENKFITMDEIFQVLQGGFTPKDLIISIRDRLNDGSFSRPGDKYGQFVDKCLTRKIPDHITNEDFIGDKERLIYMEQHFPAKGVGSLTDDDVKEILVYIGVLQEYPDDDLEWESLKESMNEAWTSFLEKCSHYSRD
ncbi:MAG: hypothetical protein HY860_01040 [Chlamydiales bacterium]|nr:hypothetical protein [Chlamydiales bacterium]